MMPVIFIYRTAFILLLSASSASAFALCKASYIGSNHQRSYQSTDDHHFDIINQTCLQSPSRTFSLSAKWKVDDHDEIDEQSIQSTKTPSSSISDRIKTGNTLELLAVAISLFFLATVGLSGDQLFNNDLATTRYEYATNNDGKTHAVYKHVDADKVLQEDFDRYDSKVTFDED